MQTLQTHQDSTKARSDLELHAKLVPDDQCNKTPTFSQPDQPKMPGWIPKKFPGKVGQFQTAISLAMDNRTDLSAAEPMIPFYAAGLIVLYAVNAGANAMMGCK